jgi:hypothetical protein
VWDEYQGAELLPPMDALWARSNRLKAPSTPTVHVRAGRPTGVFGFIDLGGHETTVALSEILWGLRQLVGTVYAVLTTPTSPDLALNSPDTAWACEVGRDQQCAHARAASTMGVMSGYLAHASTFGRSSRPARRRSHLPLATVGQWAMLLVALAGLFAMHGLSDHGVGGTVPMSSSASENAGHQAGQGADQTAMQTAMQTADHEIGHGMALNLSTNIGTNTGLHGVSVAEPAGSMEGHSDGGGHGHGGDGLLVGVCLAVIAAVILLGVAAWHARLLREVRGFLIDLARPSVTAIRARARGPATPNLRVLSIQRC